MVAYGYCHKASVCRVVVGWAIAVLRDFAVRVSVDVSLKLSSHAAVKRRHVLEDFAANSL